MKTGVFFLLLGILALSVSVVANPVDYFNFIEGIALSTCGVSLLAMRNAKKDKTKFSDPVVLSSISMTSSGRTTTRTADGEQIISEVTDRATSDIAQEIVVAEDVAHNRVKPPLAFHKKQTESVDSLIDAASSFITD
jgi:hypothetical protein